VNKKFYQPERGDFIYLSFSPHAGTEQAGDRPALVLSPMDFNIATGLALVCPLTNQMKGGSFEVQVPRGAGLSGVVLTDQVRSLDWIARGARFHSKAPQDLVFEVLGRIEAILSIDLDPADT
jgi:mRNA interferase MazF